MKLNNLLHRTNKPSQIKQPGNTQEPFKTGEHCDGSNNADGNDYNANAVAIQSDCCDTVEGKIKKVVTIHQAVIKNL